MTGQRGFSLLEAIVALALLASVGMALLSWLNGSLISLRRVQEVAAVQAAARDASNPALRQALNLLGPPGGDGRWALNSSGVLPW